MKNWKLNITLFVVAYVVFMLAMVPASMVVGSVTLPPTVKLGEVSGSIWNGNISAVQLKNDVINDVNWQLSPLRLLTGSLSGNVKFGNSRKVAMISGAGDVSTNFSFDHFSASDFTLNYPAAELVDRLGLPIPADIGGRVVLKLNDYDQGKPYCETLDGTMVWSKATVKFGKEFSIGKIDAELGCTKGEVELKITKKNPLGLQITSLIGAKNKFTAKGFVKPNGDMPTEVHNMMKLLDQPDSQGRFPVNL
jgi:general secretion pathway protein N